MVKTVVREHHWSPALVGDLFLDRINFEGLEYWHDDVVEMHKPKKK